MTMPRHADDDLLALAHVAPAWSVTDAVDAALADPDRAVDMLLRHRVVTAGELRLRGRVPGVSEWADRYALLRKLLVESWAELGAGVAQLGLAVAGIKGLATRGLYRDGSIRDVGDLDVLVDDVDEAWRLAGWLRSRGYDWYPEELPWLKRDAATGLVYGQVAVRRYVGPVPLRVDVHFAGYSVRHCRLAPCPLSGTGLHLWEPAENLPLLLGNAAGDYVIRLKDINDITLMLEAEPRLAWEPALGRVRAVGLDRFWNAVLDQVLRTSELSGRARALAGELRFPGVRPERVPLGEKDWSRRCRATAVDAFRSGSGPVRKVRRACGAWRYYRRPLQLRVTDRCRHGRADAGLLEHLRNDVCVRLVPTRMVRERSGTAAAVRLEPGSGSLVPGTRTLRQRVLDGHSYALIGGETFATTVFYDLCAAQGGYD
ncbi:MAG: nucleotidyltransferase family protein [Mycobacteriales bacterium]